LWIEGGIAGEMTEQEEKQLISRLRRLAGQARSLETALAGGDNAMFVGQMEAVIAAGRAALSQFTQVKLLGSDEPEDRKLLARIIRKG